MSRAGETADDEAAKRGRDAQDIALLVVFLWILFLVSLPYIYMLYWWRPLYYEGFTTERALTLAFNFFLALAVILALLLSLTVAATAIAIRSELKKLMLGTRTSGGSQGNAAR